MIRKRSSRRSPTPPPPGSPKPPAAAAALVIQVACPEARRGPPAAEPAPSPGGRLGGSFSPQEEIHPPVALMKLSPRAARHPSQSDRANWWMSPGLPGVPPWWPALDEFRMRDCV
ncbi:sterile alpha motif domain-containing protein 1-like [Ursus americanus]|uniref:sterile alpha motif domain-containing protein 1-like n=1 Tax=Ursus americanus TaxID=9643 RepID=UPI001E67965B|nr:sterile alpha motif domain-containing protein 1-like [Ursus americanus]